MKPYVIGFYGESNSGKTTLIVKIINCLSKEDFRIASVKTSDKKSGIDSEGKDTWKHSQAGSELVVFSTKNEVDFLLKKNVDNSEIIDCIKKIGKYDIILIEGANDENIQKIRIGEIKERKNTIFTYNGNFEELINFIKTEIFRRN